jgi:hypothetical protein
MINKLFAQLGVALFACALTSPVALVAQDRDDHRYYDRHHKDYHAWNDHEDRAYHRYWEGRHRPYRDFNGLSERERQNYWDWRHDHSDAILKIDIR